MDSMVFFYVDGIPTKGGWFDGDDFDTAQDVIETLATLGLCSRYYGGDILAADAEGLARHFLSEHDVFDFAGWVTLRDDIDSGDDEGAIDAYIGWHGEWDRESFEDRYIGKFGSRREWAEEYIENTGYLDNVPEHIARYFDTDAFARDAFAGGDVCEVNGHYFNNN